MTTGILMVKRMDGSFVPANEEERQRTKRFKVGHIVEFKATQKLNMKFWRKWWALIGVGFEAWSELVPAVEYQGMSIQPNFERFRKDITILAGHYERVFDLRGNFVLEARSVSPTEWANDEAFEAFYSATINALLDGVLGKAGYNEETLRQHVERLLAFD